jgi:thymidylate synthase
MTYLMQEYDNALEFILKNGEKRKTRTGVDCLTVFSLTTSYDISENFPLVTRRKLYPKSVFAELLWMLSGSTNNEDLKALGANFWTPWADPIDPKNKAFYEKTGFPVGYLGPIYGWQMRHFGANYNKWIFNKDHRDSSTASEALEKGFDQISWLVSEIKSNPDSRRLIVSLWNPPDLEYMRLPPCHYCFHVSVDNHGRMSLLLNQRSCDFPVGVPANIQFYSALCYMLAQQTGYKPYKFIHHAEDAHIYETQIEHVKKYLNGPTYDSPKLVVNKASNILNYKVNDFSIVDYKYGDPIKIPVEV